MKPSVSFSVLLSLSLLSSVVSASGANPPRLQSSDQVAAAKDEAALHSYSQFVIPGPRRSFLRMAGISQKITPEEVLPLLSRNVYTQGFQGTSQPTEFLILLRRYVVQARELASLAEKTGGVLRVTGCDDAGPVLRILGYRI